MHFILEKVNINFLLLNQIFEMFLGLKQINMTPLKSSDGNTLRYRDNFPERFIFFCSFTFHVSTNPLI